MQTFTVAENAYGIELALEGTVAAYVVADERPAVIETGVAESADELVAGIQAVGVDPTSIEHIVVGHAHIDHSGGAKTLLDHAPEATVYLHESMMEWLTDPDRFDRLVTSSRRALEPRFEQVGAPDGPLPAKRIEPVSDVGMTVDTGDRTFEITHTPGHSVDHVSVWDSANALLFANEAIGRYFPKADTWLPPTTAPSFDPQAVKESMGRLRDLDPETLVLSHVGVRPDVETAFNRARDRLDTFLERIPDLYEVHDGDLEATRETVGEELIDLRPEYSAAEQALQVRFATDCILKSLDLL